MARITDDELVGICIEEIEDDPSWIARPEWAREEGIRGFGGAPLTARGAVLGALAIYWVMDYSWSATR